MGALRLALVGAFPYPLPQGSQVYFEGQARALLAAGCECTLFTYGRGVGPPPSDLRVVRSDAKTAPKRMRSGPSLGKPRADAALLRRLLAESGRTRFDALLAHNAEAAAIGLAARARTGTPVIYVVHTLLGVELSAYLPGWPRGAVDAVGRRVDRALARRADALIALSEPAAAALAPHTRAPLETIVPGLRPRPAPDAGALRAACDRHRLEADRFVLYTGNLDAYQELELLDAAAARLGPEGPEIVVATHGDATARFEALRVVHARDFEEMRALSFAAQTLVSTRRRVGGFPIKLLNYMETGRPIVAVAGVAEGLVHDESAWLLPPAGGPAELARALRTLARDPERRLRLGRGARAHLDSAHDWRVLAERTKALVRAAIAKRGPGRDRA